MTLEFRLECCSSRDKEYNIPLEQEQKVNLVVIVHKHPKQAELGK